MTAVGIIDIGSNSIKSLVVRDDAQGNFIATNEGRSATRIGTGLSDTPPSIRAEDIDAAAAAINHLIRKGSRPPHESAAEYDADEADDWSKGSASNKVSALSDTAAVPAFQLYATSAIREASNREAVAAELSDRCHAPLTVLSGEEEATLIGWAARSVPDLAAAPDLLLADLGGGSLELLQLQGGRIRQQCSLHLGAVRLTTDFFHGGLAPIDAGWQDALARHTDALFVGSGFDFSVAKSSVLVGSGGALSALHHMDCFAPCEEHSEALGDIPLMPVHAMADLYASACAQDSAARASVSGFPRGRADIMPAALLVLLRLARLCHASAYAYCSHNLRFGLAAWQIYHQRATTRWTLAEPVPAITIHT